MFISIPLIPKKLIIFWSAAETIEFTLDGILVTMGIKWFMFRLGNTLDIFFEDNVFIVSNSNQKYNSTGTSQV
jgi:hypothetical protein